MHTPNQGWLPYLLGPALVVYILNQLYLSISNSYKEWWKLRHTAICIKREVVINRENLENFIFTVPSIEEKTRANENYKPFMVSSNNSDIVKYMRESMLQLPSEAVDAIIEFYLYDSEVNEVMRKMDTQEYMNLNGERKCEVIAIFRGVLEEMKAASDMALSQLDKFIAERDRGFLYDTTMRAFASAKNNLRVLWDAAKRKLGRSGAGTT